MSNKILKCFVLGFVLLSTGISVNAQSGDKVGTWLMYFGQNRLSDNWSLHSEIQYRNHTTIPGNAEQLLIRTGLNYHTNSGALLTVGYGYIRSYIYDSQQSNSESNEHRIFQQLITTQQLSKIKLEHRYRVEQRWVNSDYRGRLRYRLMAFIPLNKPRIEPGVLFIALYDELFINTQQTFFDRNRIYGALGYQMSPIAQIQIGLLNQRVNKFDKTYFQVGLSLNPDLRQKNEN